MTLYRSLISLLAGTLLAQPAWGLPALQLGPGSVGTWNYNNTSQTWVTDTNPFSVNAYANSDTAGANGSFAWDPDGAADRYAYLVVSAVPMVNADLFDVTVENDGGILPVFASGFGAPPIQDTNNLAPHSIFDTYFELYQFQFDESVTTIFNTQPGGSGSGDGYVEVFDVTINGLTDPVHALHFDLFTVSGDGTFDPESTIEDRKLVKDFAPFSHDAQHAPEPSSVTLFLIGAGIFGAVVLRRRGRRGPL